MEAVQTLTLLLDDREQAYLRELLQNELGETRVEERHTQRREYHDALHDREDVIRGLLKKIGAAAAE